MTDNTVKMAAVSQLRLKLAGKPLVGFDTTHWGEVDEGVSTKGRVGGKDGKTGFKTGKVGIKTGKVGIKSAPSRT